MTRLAVVAVGGKVLASVENADRAALNKVQLLITPGTVSTGSIGTYGAVTVAAAASVSINNCFTSEFDLYIVKFDLTTSAGASLTAVLRLAGVDSGTGYDRQENTGVNGTATETQVLNATTFRMTGTNLTGRHTGTIELAQPGVALQTTGTVVSGGAANPMAAASGSRFQSFLSHRPLTAYDGISIIPTSGTISGTIRVIGVI